MPLRRHIAISILLCFATFDLAFLARSGSTPDYIIYRHGYGPTELFESVRHTLAIASNARSWTLLWEYNDPHHQESDLGWTTGPNRLLWLHLGGSIGDDQMLTESGELLRGVGYAYQEGTFTSEDTVQESFRRAAIGVPQGCPAALSFLAVAFLAHRSCCRLLTRRQRRSHGPSLCRKCHYDLRAHVPGGRCPECGTAIPRHRA